MRQVKIEYENFERDENKALVAEIVLAYAWLFPVWLKTLTVSVYDRHAESETMNAWSSGNLKYGTADVGIKTNFFEKPTQWQHELVAHELVHIAHMQIAEYVHERLIAPIKERNEELYSFLASDVYDHIEHFVEHMALGLVANMQGTSATVTIHPPKTWRPEELHRSDAQVVPEHKPLAMVGHRRREGDGHD